MQLLKLCYPNIPDEPRHVKFVASVSCGGDVAWATPSWSRAAAVPPRESASIPAVEPASRLPLAGTW